LIIVATLSGFFTSRWSTGPALPSSLALFGASVRPRGEETQRHAVERLEEMIGRALDAVRVYKRWNDDFPSAYDRWLLDSGRTIFLSVAAQWRGGELIPWRRIADAQEGSDLYRTMVSWAERLRGAGSEIFLTFDHEPENEPPSVMGKPSDFVDAWRRFFDVLRARGATNVRPTLVLTAYTYARQDSRGAAAWYPGDEFVDVLAADGYNFYGCRAGVAQTWRPFAQVFAGFQAFVSGHPSKQIAITEWGSVEDPMQAGRKAGWIDEAAATLAGPEWDRLIAVLYWHSANPPCEFWVDSSPEALEAFARMGASPRFYRPAPPTIRSVEPGSGPPGTAVRITGMNFIDVEAVTFNAVPAPFSVRGLAEIEATVPLGASAGPVVVRTAHGTATSPQPFRVHHPRDLSLRRGGMRGLRGRVIVGDGFTVCAARQPVRIERWVRGLGWKGARRVLTRADGSFSAEELVRSARYRARAPRRELASLDTCLGSVSRAVRIR
jgi:hypothetical protein